MKDLKTNKDRLKAIEDTVSIINELEKNPSPILKPVIVKFNNKLDYLNSRHGWLFNFMGGGWNSMWAYTEEEAIQEALKKYNDVNINTFRLKTDSEEESLLSLFY